MSIFYAQGMSRTTGRLLEPFEHLRQSIYDILTTPIGSRLIRREYGSLLPFLIDEPMNPAIRLKIMSAVATSIIKFEPRVKVAKVALNLNTDSTNTTGNVGFDVNLDLKTADNRLVNTSLTLVRGAS